MTDKYHPDDIDIDWATISWEGVKAVCYIPVETGSRYCIGIDVPACVSALYHQILEGDGHDWLSGRIQLHLVWRCLTYYFLHEMAHWGYPTDSALVEEPCETPDAEWSVVCTHLAYWDLIEDDEDLWIWKR